MRFRAVLSKPCSESQTYMQKSSVQAFIKFEETMEVECGRLKDAETSIGNLRDVVRRFINNRDWEKYHNPKDIAESVCIEAAELLQLFQWVKPGESMEFKHDSSRMKRIEGELADVILYCLSMANTLEIDLTTAILNKVELNSEKYPVDLYKGKAHLT